MGAKQIRLHPRSYTMSASASNFEFTHNVATVISNHSPSPKEMLLSPFFIHTLVEVCRRERQRDFER